MNEFYATRYVRDRAGAWTQWTRGLLFLTFGHGVACTAVYRSFDAGADPKGDTATDGTNSATETGMELPDPTCIGGSVETSCTSRDSSLDEPETRFDVGGPDQVLDCGGGMDATAPVEVEALEIIDDRLGVLVRYGGCPPHELGLAWRPQWPGSNCYPKPCPGDPIDAEDPRVVLHLTHHETTGGCEALWTDYLTFDLTEIRQALHGELGFSPHTKFWLDVVPPHPSSPQSIVLFPPGQAPTVNKPMCERDEPCETAWECTYSELWSTCEGATNCR